eukprot:COSAG06_NODE_10666_length_1640_cov_1.230370_1_plen_302_part_10
MLAQQLLLGAVIAAAAGASSSRGSERAAAPLLPFGVVDTHVHMATTTNGINYSWAHDPSTLDPPQQCPCRPPCACNMTIPEYQHASAAWEVSDVVFCEVSANADDWLKESRWVQSLADGPFKHSKPRVGAIMAQPPPGFGTSPVSNYSQDLDQLQREVPLVRGVRTTLADHTPDKLAALKELGRRGLVVDFLSDIVTGIPFHIIQDTPDVKYQIEHLGCGCGVAALYANQTKYKQWQAAIKQLATLPNIQALQVGGTMAGFHSKEAVDAATIKPFVQTVVKEFGFDRLVFEANWFFCNFLPD